MPIDPVTGKLTVDPAFVRSNAAEQEAIRTLGMTKAEIDARGGISASGYFGDSWSSKTNLTDAEYLAALKEGGGSAINAATEAKVEASKPPSERGNAGSNPAPSISTASTLSAEAQDAYALLKSVFTKYNLTTLIPAIEDLMKNNVGPEQASLLLKTDPKYNKDASGNLIGYAKRFQANAARIANGLNAIDEATYLDIEDQYSQTLKSYGKENYFGATMDDRQKAMAGLIAGDVSPTEFKGRIDLAVARVENADPTIKAQLKAYYSITDADLTNYFLNPKENLPKLEEKVKAAEIGGAAAAQNLSVTAATAEDLAKYGVTQEQARQGYADIAEVLPTSEKLGAIYDEMGVKYGQAEAEQDTFKGLASAKRKKEQLSAREIAEFSGSSGTGLGSGALSTQYLRRGSASGQF
jgi:hypothetical protein